MHFKVYSHRENISSIFLIENLLFSWKRFFFLRKKHKEKICLFGISFFSIGLIYDRLVKQNMKFSSMDCLFVCIQLES